MYKLLYKIKNAPRDIKRGIKSLIYWLPIIWENNWWDSGYLLDLMQHQIKLMEKNWVKNTHHVGDELIKEDMVLCLECLDRLTKEEYFTDGNFFDDDLNYIGTEEGLQRARDIKAADIDVLFNTLKKYESWWD